MTLLCRELTLFMTSFRRSDLSLLPRLLKNSPSAFEKYCDDAVMENMKKAKYTAFGLGPIATYIFARMTEIGCVRIILSAKFNGTSEETVRERMRELYV